MRTIRILIAFAAFGICPCLGDDAQDAAPYDALSRIVRAAHTTDLPAIDRIEVLVLPLAGEKDHIRESESGAFLVRPASPNANDGGIRPPLPEISVIPHSSRMLDAKSAERIADDWRSLSFRRNSAFCHVPTYGLRFFHNKKLIFSVSVCWKCHNFYLPVIDPQTGRPSIILYGFEDNAAAKKLLNDLRRLVPHPDIRHPRLR